MANLIIKPTSGGSLILQDEGGTAAHTIDASGNHTLSGTTNNLGTATAGTLSSGVTFPAGHVLQVVYKELTYGGDESAGTSNQLWREDSTAGTINITLINANAKVYFSCMQGDCFSSGGCTIVTEMAARAGSSNLSVTDPQDDSGAIRWPKRHQYRLTADDDRVMFVEGVMDVTNSANEAWCFGPTCYATSGSFFTNYAGANGRGSMVLMEIQT